MRRIIICIILVLFSFSGAYAQLVKGYGLKAGMVAANQDFDYSQGLEADTENRIGLDVGVFAEWLNHSYFSILTEIHYIQKGHTVESTRTDEFGNPLSTVKHNNRLDYLSIPLLAKITLRTQYALPYLVIGPRFDYLLGYQSEISKELFDEFKNTGVGGTVGLGLESKSKPVKFLLEFRYSPDFTNAYKSDMLKVKNSSFEILFGLRL
jgi:hypothetical protein